MWVLFYVYCLVNVFLFLMNRNNCLKNIRSRDLILPIILYVIRERVCDLPGSKT